MNELTVELSYPFQSLESNICLMNSLSNISQMFRTQLTSYQMEHIDGGFFITIEKHGGKVGLVDPLSLKLI